MSTTVFSQAYSKICIWLDYYNDLFSLITFWIVFTLTVNLILFAVTTVHRIFAHLKAGDIEVTAKETTTKGKLYLYLP